MDKLQPKKVFLSLRIKLLVGFTLLFSLVFTAASYWVYRLETEDMIRRIGQDLEGTLRGTAQGLKGDDVIALARTGQPNADGFSDDPRYAAQMDWFELVKSIEPRAWPYTYVRGEKENEIIFVADLWARYDPDRAAGFLEAYEQDSMYHALDEFTLDLEIEADQWGSWVSVYMPVPDSQNSRAAAVGIDFEASNVAELQNKILRNIFIVFIIAYVIGCVLVYVLAGFFSRPLVKLAAMAEQVGEGQYDLDFGGLHGAIIWDEIGTLAKVFEIMARKVYQREQTLVQQVHQLRIEIDEVKRQKQVSEIVDTDFFRDLQAKARAMRDRSASDSDKTVG